MQIAVNSEGWSITPPGYRFDIAIEADLLEEIGRIYGYNNLPNSSLLMRSELGKADEFIRIQNPISSELSVMRTTLWCGLLNAALYNTKRQQSRVRLFETGLRFIRKNKEMTQQRMLSGLVLGSAFAEQWSEKTRKVDFFDLKGDLESLFHLTECRVQYIATKHPALHPGQCARIENVIGEEIGLFGMLHPTLEKTLGFESPVFLFELDQNLVFKKQIPKFSALSKFPSVRRDLALIVKEKVTAAEVINCIHSCNEEIIQEVLIFDVYRGVGVEDGFKSIALSLILQDSTQTLTDSEIDAIFNNILDTLKSNLSAKLRD